MNIIWFSWKDRNHPEAGGAETVSGEIMDRLVKDGHSVQLITAGYKNAKQHDFLNGVEVFRSGNRYSSYLKAYGVYKKMGLPKVDVVIDEMNTLPFAAGLYTRADKKILLTYQLAREVWFYQMIFPISLIGYLTEPIMLRVINRLYHKVLTESESTKNDLKKYGFKNIDIFRVGMETKPIETLPQKITPRTVLSLGAVRPMKRTLHAVKAFEYARDTDSSLKMIVAGDISTKYAKKVLSYIQSSRHSSSIDIKGRVSIEEKMDLMKESGVILVTSIKEGWGLIITEANSQGTPAIAYDADGLRDSVKANETGILSPSGNPKLLGLEINKLFSDDSIYNSLRQNAWSLSKDFTFDNSYADFLKKIK